MINNELGLNIDINKSSVIVNKEVLESYRYIADGIRNRSFGCLVFNIRRGIYEFRVSEVIGREIEKGLDISNYSEDYFNVFFNGYYYRIKYLFNNDLIEIGDTVELYIDIKGNEEEYFYLKKYKLVITVYDSNLDIKYKGELLENVFNLKFNPFKYCE